MKLRFWNHACVEVEAEGHCLVMDPWLDGRVFDDAWELLAPSTEKAAEVVGRADYVWYSHEHGDHFSPRALREAAVNVDHVRASEDPLPTVLYQPAIKRTLLSYAEGLCYHTRELSDGVLHTVGPFRLRTGPVGLYDSWLAISAEGKTVLNLNDCEPNEVSLASIRDAVGPVDVLCVQFGVACFRESPEAMRGFAADLRDRVRKLAQAFGAKAVVPFASFVRFCHEENAWVNECQNKVGDVVGQIVGAGASPVVMFPGDSWEVGTPSSSLTLSALERWAEAYAASRDAPVVRNKPCPVAELETLAEAWSARRLSDNGAAALDLLRMAGRGALPVYLTDHMLDVAVDLREGLLLRRGGESGLPIGDAACLMSSSALAGVLRTDFGWDSLFAGARLQGSAEGVRRAEDFFHVASLNHHGRRIEARVGIGEMPRMR